MPTALALPSLPPLPPPPPQFGRVRWRHATPTTPPSAASSPSSAGPGLRRRRPHRCPAPAASWACPPLWPLLTLPVRNGRFRWDVVCCNGGPESILRQCPAEMSSVDLPATPALAVCLPSYTCRCRQRRRRQLLGGGWRAGGAALTHRPCGRGCGGGRRHAGRTGEEHEG